MMLLMQKYTKDNGAVGVDNVERWPVDSDAALFFVMTISAASVDELMEVSKKPRLCRSNA